MMAIESIIHATEVLSKLSAINIQDLLPHRCALEHTFDIIKNTLESIHSERSQTSPARSFSSETPSTTPSVPRPEPHAGRDTERNDLSEDTREDIASDLKSLSRALSDCKQSQKIKEYLCSTDLDPINYSGGDWTQEDPRVVDIQFCSRTCSLDSKFRRGLAQRSLAIEFDNWERAEYQSSRVSELHQDPDMADYKQNGHIHEFLQSNADRFKDRNSTLHGIKHGIRLLVFELIFGHAGVSAILVLFYSHFRGVKYKNHIELKSLILESPWQSLAIHKSSWLEDCQHRYDTRSVTWRVWQNIWGATEGGREPQWPPAQCRHSIDEPISLSEQRHVATESQTSQERESNVSMPRILADETQSLEPQVAGPIEATTVAIDSQQIATHRQLAAPSVGGSSVDMRPAVQNASFRGPDPLYSGSIHSFNPLDYSNLLADSDSERISQEISSTGFVFNPLDYPNLPPPLPDPDVEFVFNPLNYPGIPSDPQNGDLENRL
ncbi:uncharacterized protein KD926_008968 [Aspergillus affinis]|uniref:uncharacterized protein n=1 Tax=Aspergillus affinis TaxID=1070780 RepID=UPI0022FE3031|nr:uncharacterized protein KD926_008968 [Aspergillus affinis]KAI9039867.1 hypothetical protein KD926_008968 [Aspergillus affinis]